MAEGTSLYVSVVAGIVIEKCKGYIIEEAIKEENSRSLDTSFFGKLYRQPFRNGLYTLIIYISELSFESID